MDLFGYKSQEELTKAFDQRAARTAKKLAAKPKCKLTGTDGNVFALIGKAAKVLKDAGQRQKAQEMNERCFASGSYHEALAIIQEYVDVS